MIFNREDFNNDVFFTSDHHFGHENIIKYCDRPFADVYEMDSILAGLWNNIVGKNDTVFHLGDFTLGDFKRAEYYFGQLNGQVYILTNDWHHDKRWLEQAISDKEKGLNQLFTKSGGIRLIPPIVVFGGSSQTVEDSLVLCHYPLAVWDRKHHGTGHIFGHSHTTKKYSTLDRAMNVGVDLNEFTPVLYEDVVDNINTDTKSNSGKYNKG